MLPRLYRLDVRPSRDACAAPLAAAVNIPLKELAARTHELPPRDQEVQVVGPSPGREAAVAWLRGHGRRALAAEAPQSGALAPGRLWSPTAFLEEQLEFLGLSPAACVLDLACGTGRDAVYLAQRGHHVTAIDCLPDALDRGRDLERRYAAGAMPIEWRQDDIESDDFSPVGRFELITIFRFLWRPLLPRLREWLNPGGVALLETFSREHSLRHGRPQRESLTLQPGELQRLLCGYELLSYSEAWRGESHTQRAAIRAPQPPH